MAIFQKRNNKQERQATKLKAAVITVKKEAKHQTFMNKKVKTEQLALPLLQSGLKWKFISSFIKKMAYSENLLNLTQF